jgi:hypothetical protein
MSMSTHLTTHELDAARAKYRGKIIPGAALSVMDAERKPFGLPGSSAGHSSPAQSLRILYCLTPRAAASASNHCCVKVQSFLSFTEAAGAPIATCTCEASNELCQSLSNLGRKL